jgi:hypothetical protein
MLYSVTCFFLFFAVATSHCKENDIEDENEGGGSFKECHEFPYGSGSVAGHVHLFRVVLAFPLPFAFLV